MNLRKLQFGKAMSAALFVLLLVVAGTKNALAQTQVATLQHGEEISVFYGQNAFVEAHAAAETGDIITLSSGTFLPTAITKAITLRGAGCAIDTVANTPPTNFGGTIVFGVDDTDNKLTIEGILFNNSVSVRCHLHSPKLTRCNFENFQVYNVSFSMSDAQFTNCIIDKFNFNYTQNTVFINSVVWDAYNNNQSIVLYNSIMRGAYNNISAYNSIIIESELSSSYCSFTNCIGVSNSSTPFGQGYVSGCIAYESYTDVFETFNGTFDMGETFILKDEIATGFLGNDGTEVGIHGGFMPYSNRPTYMVLKRCNVANKSTIDGKLSVDIEVVTEE